MCTTAHASAVTDERLTAYFTRTAEAQRHRQTRGRLCSEKMAAHMEYTFLVQRDAMILLELRHSVRSYGCWPDPVHVTVGGRTFPYRASVGARLADGAEAIIDIVRTEDAGTPERLAADELLAAAAVASGKKHIVMRDRAVAKDAMLPNARDVMRAVGGPADATAERACLGMLADGPMTLGGLRASESARSGLRRAACVLAMRRVLAIDLRAPTPDDCTVAIVSREAA